MSYEFKMKGHGNGRKSRLYKKTKRASMNRMDVSHLPMRMKSDIDGHWGQTSRGRGQFSYKEVENFLMARVGRPVNDVFSEFVVEMKKHEQNESIKETFDYFFDYEEERMKGYQWASGFYVTNGILNYKKYSRKKQAFSPKHIRWNKTHIDREMLERFQPYDSYLFQRHKTTGPLFIGKLWVSVKGNYMLLPVWSVYRGKYEAKLSNDPHIMALWNKSSVEHMKLFTRVIVIGEGDSYRVSEPSSWGRYYDRVNYYDYIVKITDIEEYTKQKFKES
ncbi:hypothetical protein PhiCrAssBcn17_85 [Bacteroides phage PhiCrAssBcn17]|nr:hypothetical protein PhiCrAssBcn4_87 [Bacteroides phage PhiCrAssBcn4]WCF57135.1 hypothetical protein PhiCrAssBcn13_83 [Bacteroides phage PhiCrAssBcn13]WCF57746.1 hypothetical protein PhiCrAssBcn5_98 [Bacteroides phage PhiCrAssBcn5]WCF57811.1 hypothetical protein PhiCrAssBcn6_58 [Bacteroides phage PhiCrAssBcn6]WCF57879.1 hypothetical protein PhiCrAssBcn7_21 [Bacteroides phage PhiCrAssBcn7]WCF58049.1 hypothetical protein PhiCrAssBcn8_86 [Bacteroides phage PhiCrAssBcn8]WCF58687.1 hypothetical